jgi:hypothetical protein
MPNLMVGLPLYYLISLKEFIKESLIIQKARKPRSSTIEGQTKHGIMFIWNLSKGTLP